MKDEHASTVARIISVRLSEMPPEPKLVLAYDV